MIWWTLMRSPSCVLHVSHFQYSGWVMIILKVGYWERLLLLLSDISFISGDEFSSGCQNIKLSIYIIIWISYWTETSCVQSFSVAIALSLDLRNITQVTSFKNKPLFLTLLLLFFVTFLKRTKISRGELWKKLLIIIIINTFWLFLQLLVSVGLEDYHLICVWNWKKGKILASTRGHTDRVSYHD